MSAGDIIFAVALGYIFIAMAVFLSSEDLDHVTGDYVHTPRMTAWMKILAPIWPVWILVWLFWLIRRIFRWYKKQIRIAVGRN